MSNDDLCALCAPVDHADLKALASYPVHGGCFTCLHLAFVRVEMQCRKAPLLLKDNHCGAAFDLLVGAVPKKIEDFNWLLFRFHLQNFCEVLERFQHNLEEYIEKAAENLAQRIRSVMDAVTALLNTAVAIALTQCKLKIKDRRVAV